MTFLIRLKKLKQFQSFNQFNFSSQSLFLVGHSISGTVFNAMSLLSDANGIVFEASDGETNLNYIEKSRLKKMETRIHK